jgi:hypothetical protein
MSTLTLALVKAQIMKHHKRANMYIVRAQSEPQPATRRFMYARAWALYSRAENLSDLVP